MSVHPLLRARLEPLVRQSRRFQLICRLACCWGAGALLGVAILGLEQALGWSSALALPLAAFVGLGLAASVAFRLRAVEPDWRAVALRIEKAHPELKGCLLTAVQQDANRPGEFGYLQQRVLEEALAHYARADWDAGFPRSHLLFAHAVHICSLAVFAWMLWELRVPIGRRVFVPSSELAVTVTPGDIALERGSSLVVSARFKGQLPPRVELLLGGVSAATNRIPMVKSLGDPLFGGIVPEVSKDLTYHLEYAGKRTREYTVSIFDYPRLERADADISYPEYTRLPARHVENTRRLSAVEGSRIALKLQLNKPVAEAALISKGTNRVKIQLSIQENVPAATLTNLLLAASGNYELLLVDAEARTNKVPAQFVLDALKNRPPELKVASPRGDTRPSALEEVVFEGTVYDDFGVRAFGIASAVAGKEPRIIELGQNVPGREKRPFQFLLRLEELGLQVDDLVSWFVWAEDIGPDGNVRRTAGDLYFAEVRPFDEVFREGQSMSAGEQEQQQSGQERSQAGRLAELQKQIISATWKLLRQNAEPFSQRGGGAGGASDRGRGARGGEAGDPASKSTDTRFVTNIGTLAGKFAGGRGTRGERPAVEFPSVPALAFGQRASPDSSSDTRSSDISRPVRRRAEKPAELADDMNVVRDAQEQALEQAESAKGQQQNPRSSALWEDVTRQMERALEKLRSATNSPAEFQAALAAEQAAYKALLKLQEHEFSVSRSRRQQGSQGGRSQQLQRQLDQLDLSQAQDRYETERQARAPQSPERSEQLQVMNRLQELARRQQDLNQRLQELQTALQEARTEQEREELRRQLKRLQDEEQQLVADADEVRQRMDRPENQSRMSDQRQQMEQARNDLQRAAEAAQQGQTSQALASGTRAQRQLQQMREDMRRQNAGEFEQELRQMRSDARELARQQEELQKKIESLNDPRSRTLTDADLQKQTLEDVARQSQRLTNLVAGATELSRQTEEAEPLVSRELYDTVRRFSQNEAGTSKQFREEFINRRMMDSDLYQKLKRAEEASDAKVLDITSEMLRRGMLADAGVAEERARSGINDLKRGVERAAQNVVGDDTESLRRAREELDRMAEQLEKEIVRAEGGSSTNLDEGRGPRVAGRGGAQPGQVDANPRDEGQRDQNGQQDDSNPNSGRAQEQARNREEAGGSRGEGAGPRQPPTPAATQEQAQAQPSGPAGGEQGQNSEPGQRGDEARGARGEGRDPTGDSREAQARDPANRDNSSRGGNTARNGQRSGGGGGGNRLASDLDRWLDGRGGTDGGPITGEDFAAWSDGLREVEELVDTPSLRTDITRARERARQMRQDYKRSQKKPDWAAVRLQVLKPLVEVRNQVSEELARREPLDKLVPIDRDPVPGRYSELVRRYYEELGRGHNPSLSPPASVPSQ